MSWPIDAHLLEVFFIVFAQLFFVASRIAPPAAVRLTQMLRAGRHGAGDALEKKN